MFLLSCGDNKWLGIQIFLYLLDITIHENRYSIDT